MTLHLFLEREKSSFITESNLLNEEGKLNNMNKGRSASLHSMRGFRKKSQNTEEPSLPPFFLCDAFFCLYLIDAVNNQQESREREREGGRHSKGPWLRFKPGPAALNHTAYGCLFTEVNQRPIPKFNFTETCPCLGEYNRIK